MRGTVAKRIRRVMSQKDFPYHWVSYEELKDAYDKVKTKGSVTDKLIIALEEILRAPRSAVNVVRQGKRPATDESK